MTDMQHPDSCFCFDCLGPNQSELLNLSRELFDCLMNRIFSANDFTRLGGVSKRERAVFDTYKHLTGGGDAISTSS